jgi:hypothetical protein
MRRAFLLRYLLAGSYMFAKRTIKHGARRYPPRIFLMTEAI